MIEGIGNPNLNAGIGGSREGIVEECGVIGELALERVGRGRPRW